MPSQLRRSRAQQHDDFGALYSSCAGRPGARLERFAILNKQAVEKVENETESLQIPLHY